MASNTISRRVYEFMSQYPPFNLIKTERLLLLSEQVVIRYFEENQQVFVEGEAAGKYIYLVRKGSVALSKSVSLVDICDEGDLFGVRSMLSGLPYVLTALTREESLLYAIPVSYFEPELNNNPRLTLFFAAGLASGQSVLRDTSAGHEENRQLRKQALSFQKEENTFHLFPVDEVLENKFSKPLVSCTADISIREAALRMSTARVGSILVVDAGQRPVGIVTDTDFREKVATGEVGVDQQISSIMSSPVVTARPQTSVAEIQILMLQKKVHHICLTEDGTANLPARGILTDHDLLLIQANNASVLIKQISKADKASQLRYIRDKAESMLRQYMKQEVDIRLLSEIITAVNDAIIKKAIQMAEEAMAASGEENPGVSYCWLSLGREGRKEQLLRTDQDNALIYQDDSHHPDQTHQYFLRLARLVNEMLIECGFEKCPADIMAQNPKWCQPISGWQKHFSRWINEPDMQAILHAAIFFDFRPAYGDESLADELWHYISRQIREQDLFMRYFANNALLNPPPLSFFRNFVVEKSGEHKDEFDIKRRAMMPLADAARVLCYERGIKNKVNTSERYEALAQSDRQRSRIFNDASAAYEFLLQIRTSSGLSHASSGRYIQPRELNKIQRQSLRTIFETITEVQEILRHHFQLDYLRR
ncbi:MAG: DUF294 nucleotidyltransferase-like domain-containing protein [bacterium]